MEKCHYPDICGKEYHRTGELCHGRMRIGAKHSMGMFPGVLPPRGDDPSGEVSNLITELEENIQIINDGHPRTDRSWEISRAIIEYIGPEYNVHVIRCRWEERAGEHFAVYLKDEEILIDYVVRAMIDIEFPQGPYVGTLDQWEKLMNSISPGVFELEELRVAVAGVP